MYLQSSSREVLRTLLASGLAGTLLVAGCAAADDPEATRSTSSALTGDDAVRAACKGTYRNHGACVSCVAHAAGNGQTVASFSHGECRDQCIRTSCAVEGATCGTVPDGCGGTLTCGPPCSGGLFFPAENDAAYDVRVTCAESAAKRAGTAGACCRAGTYATETRCTTALHETRDAAGKFALVVDPMQGCVTTVTDGTCLQSGDLATCGSSGLTCPVPVQTAYGAPSLVAGTYVRSVYQMGAGTLVADEYRACGGGSALVNPMTISCSLPSIIPIATSQLTTVTRSGAGQFAARRAWGSPMGTAFCADPIRSPFPATLPNTKFFEGSQAGGSFAVTAYECTYELTLRR
jgi:hypothetical protein